MAIAAPGLSRISLPMSAASRSPEKSTATLVAPMISTSTMASAEFCTRIPVPSGVAASPTILNPEHLGSRQSRGHDGGFTFGRVGRQAQRGTPGNPAHHADLISEHELLSIFAWFHDDVRPRRWRARSPP